MITFTGLCSYNKAPETFGLADCLKAHLSPAEVNEASVDALLVIICPFIFILRPLNVTS